MGFALFLCVSGVGVLGLVAMVREFSAHLAAQRQQRVIARARRDRLAEARISAVVDVVPAASVTSVLKLIEQSEEFTRIALEPLPTTMPRATPAEVRATPLERVRSAAGSVAPPVRDAPPHIPLAMRAAPPVSSPMPPRATPTRAAAIPPPFRPRK